MSASPSDVCGGFFTSRARRIAPAHVPNNAPPGRASSRMASSKPPSVRNFKCVLLSPPGSTSPSRFAKPGGVLTKMCSTPSRESIWPCASKSPCTASIPTFIPPRIPSFETSCSARSPRLFLCAPLLSDLQVATGLSTSLPSPRLQELLFVELPHVDSLHCLAQLLRGFEHGLGVVKMRRGLDDGPRALIRVRRFEDARANEGGFGTQLAHQRGVGGRGDAAGGEIRHRQFARARHLPHQLERCAQLFRLVHQFVFAQGGEPADVADDRANVAHRLDHIARACFALGADHRRALGNPPQRLTQVARPADKGHTEIMLPDVVLLIRGCQHLAFVDEVHLQRLEHLRLSKMPDAHLGHHWNGDRLHDFADDPRRSHPRDAAFLADVGRHALERHHRAGSRLLGDARLLGRGEVPDHTAIYLLLQSVLHAPQVVLLTASLIALLTIARIHVPSPPNRLFLRLKSLLQKFLAVSNLESGRIDHHKSSLPTSQQLPFRIPNLAPVKELTAVALALEGLDNNFLIHADRAQVFDRELRSDCAHVAKPANLAHGFVQHGGDDSSVDKPGSTLILRAQPEAAHDAQALIIVVER